MALIIVERSFDQPLSAEDADTNEKRLATCLGHHAVVWLGSYLSPDRRRMICRFEAPDAESVRSANRRAGVAFERAWPARELDPDGSST